MQKNSSGKVFSYLAGICMFFPAWLKLQIILENIRNKQAMGVMNILYFFVACFLIILLCAQNKTGVIIGLGAFAGVNAFLQVPIIFGANTYGYARILCLLDVMGYIIAFLYALCMLTSIASDDKKKKIRLFWIITPICITTYHLTFNVVPCLMDIIKLERYSFQFAFYYAILPILLILFFVFALVWISKQSQSQEKNDESFFKSLDELIE